MQQVMTFVLVFCTLGIQQGLAARILGVFAHPTRSNSQFVHAIMSTLTAAGHDVTVYSPFKPSSDSGFHHVHILTEYHKSGSSLDTINYQNYVETYSKTGFACRMLRKMSHLKSDSFFQHPLVKNLLNSNESFDIVLTSATFGEQSLLVFGHKFRAPTIALLPMSTLSVIDYMAGNAVSLASAPEYFDLPFSDQMSFIERVHNILSGTVNILMNHWYDLPGQDAILQRHASSLSPPPPPVDQMVRDIALTFVNVHPSVSYPRPFPPNIVLIGGIHIDSNSPPLPQDIQELMDKSAEGVVFCSLGSIVPIDSMPHHLVQAFVEAFRKLPQRVIWKISGKRLEKLPENVIVSSWLPQQRILEHPNLKLFFTHGGLGSQLEVFRSGVPVVGLPFTTDQPYNVRLYESLGVGVGLNLHTLSEETISTALETVLSNNSYAENARRVARLYADRPMEPKALVVYWTEYVLKYGGTHLRPQAALMTWYQRSMLDVVVVFLLAIGIILFFLVKVVKCIYQIIKCTVKQWGVKCKVM